MNSNTAAVNLQSNGHRDFQEVANSSKSTDCPWFLQQQIPPTAPARQNKRLAPQPNNNITPITQQQHTINTNVTGPHTIIHSNLSSQSASPSSNNLVIIIIIFIKIQFNMILFILVSKYKSSKYFIIIIISSYWFIFTNTTNSIKSFN